MATTGTLRRPAWQTDELEEEWIEPDDQEDEKTASNATRSVSLTVPLGGSVVVREEQEKVERDVEGDEQLSQPAGTFLIREDAPAGPLLPKTPGRNVKNAIKDFFTPLPLEQMFQPPSPPPDGTSSPHDPGPSGSDHQSPHDHVLGGESDSDSPEHDGPVASPSNPMECRFTFTIPNHHVLASGTPQAQSTPGLLRFTRRGPLPFPANDPRLRLFQLQYDTFTRDHLSAMVDSIAAGSPSGSSGEPSPAVGQSFSHFAAQLSRLSERSSPSRLRSIKRIKLSPPSDYGDGDGEGANIRRPTLRRDYVSESKSLMQQIKQARDFSTISTRLEGTPPCSKVSETPKDSPQAESALNHAAPALLQIPANDKEEKSTSSSSNNSKKGTYSSLAYRRQAADLMAQIRNDIKGQGRLFSGETMVSHATGGSHSTMKQSVSSPKRERMGSVNSCVFNKENAADMVEYGRVRSPGKGNRLRNAVDSLKSSKRNSPRKLRRMESDKSLRGKAPFEVPVVAVFTASAELEDANAAAVFVASPSAAPSQEADVPPVHTGFLAPPAQSGNYPSASLRARTGEDLNRFVSSSTASGTTLTAGSTGSYSKHPGPAHITRIGPEDIPPLPERVGKMVFDKVMMKWVKDTAKATGVLADETRPISETNSTSEDPFRDIDSFKDEEGTSDRQSRRLSDPLRREAEMSRIEEVEESESEDEEEKELTSFSIGDPPSGVVQVMTGDIDSEEDEDDYYDEQAVDSEDEDDDEVDELVEMSASMSIDDVGPHSGLVSQTNAQPSRHHVSPRRKRVSPSPQVFSTPLPAPRSSIGLAPTPLRSAMKSKSMTPNKTPANPTPGHRRSVSFSDGKREGQIRGLNKNTGTLSAGEGEGSSRVSPRTRRIANAMEQLERFSYEEDSPSKTSGSSRPPTDEIQPLSLRSSTANGQGNISQSSTDRRVFTRPPGMRSPKSLSKSVKANATFLTECSFGVAHDRLVQVITDVQPFEPYWEELSVIDLSRKNLDSVARLKEFLPRLDSLCLNTNQVSYLSGIPSTVRSLSVASNALTSVASFNHLRNLENLDISNNQLDSLRQLECLRHLRELRADGNKVTSVDGLQKLDGLVKLSLEGNAIHDIDLTECRWTRLEMLHLAKNRIENINGLATLPSLVLLNLDKNCLGELDAHGVMPRLRILRVSGNRLAQLNAGSFPNLRTLYADDNHLGNLVKASRLTKLENLSLRNQRGRLLNLSVRDVRDVKRLYLSGNPLKAGFMDEPCYNLTYLEVAGCRLAALPANLAKLVPNLRNLNLNYNFVEDVRPLHGLSRLKKLTMVGSRLKTTKELIRVLRGMPEAEVLDFRMNPCTLPWYVPLLYKNKSVPGGPDGEAGDARGEKGWQEVDGEFRRGLPVEVYAHRLAYRGHIMRACPGLRSLDGVGVTEKERAKAGELLATMGLRRSVGA